MTRYITKVTLNETWLDDRPQPTLPQPQAWLGEPKNTGVLDVNGLPIFRIADPVGFVRIK